MSFNFAKNPDVIVLSQGDQGYRLVNRQNRAAIDLNEGQAKAWFEWSFREWEPILPTLLKTGLILPRKTVSYQIMSSFDSLIPITSHRYVKWYSENSDLTILFNSAAMRQNNPLLVLGPYGSLIWQGIQTGQVIGDLRVEAERVFGQDEVLAFVQRLIQLGFVEPIDQIARCILPPPVLVKEFPAPDIQFALTQSKIPWYCLWEICLECDLRCKICYLPTFRPTCSQDVVREHILEQITGAGIFYVTLLGGEALLRNDLEGIITRLRGVDIFIKLITNGQRLTLEKARALAQAGLNHIEISFDGLTPATHDDSRGGGTFVKAEEALLHAQRGNIPRVGIVLTIFEENIHEFPALPRFLQAHAVAECYLSLFRKTGLRGARSSINSIGPEQVKSLHRRLQEWHDIFPDLIITFLPVCTCGRTSVVIGADGQLRPCPFYYEHTIGNLQHMSLLNLWGKMKQILPATPSGCFVL